MASAPTEVQGDSRDATSLFAKWKWTPPSTWLKITTIDTHTAGEPLRIITSGLPPIEGTTVLEKRRYFMKHYDYIRTGLLREPRGHPDMYGAILTRSADDADFDVFFINTEGYSPMCGHAIIAIGKVVLETGVLHKTGPESEIVINTPAGKNYALVQMQDGEGVYTRFKNVPSFVYLQDQEVEVDGLGRIKFDVSFGGAFYALVNAAQLPPSTTLTAEHYTDLVSYGRKLKKAILRSYKIEHPFEADLSDLFGVIFTGKAHKAGNHSRNVNVFEDGVVDRSPTGTGVSARSALHFARGELGLNEIITIESILGTEMTVQVTEAVTFGEYEAVIPEVGGTAHIMGRNEFLFDPKDPLKYGFNLR
ncbi:hypothetical protein MMC25_005617 [Agyrium rufum]|nr:hypothetical protein [Agyrium rufum]